MCAHCASTGGRGASSDGHKALEGALWWERGWATAHELAPLLGLHSSTIRRKLDTGALPELPRASEARGCDRRIPASAVYELCPDLYQHHALPQR